MPARAVAYLIVAAAAITWGTWPLWLRASGLPPTAQATLALMTVGAAGLPFALHARRARRREAPAGRRAAARIGMACLAAADAGNHLLYFAALGAGAVAPATLAHYLAPVLVAAVAPLVPREPRSRRAIPAAVAALVGLGVLLGGGLGDGGAGAAARAALLGAGSAVFYAAVVLLGKHLNASGQWRPIEAVSFHCLGAALLLAPLAFEALAAATPAQAIGVAAPALVLGLGGGTAFYVGLRRIPAAHASVLTFLEPLVSVAVAVVAFGEAAGAGAIAGGALILAAGVAVATERLEGRPPPVSRAAVS